MPSVAVLGCGNMGSALALALARGGFAVRVWNRSAEKAERLARDEERIEVAAGAADAVRGAAVTIVIVADYEVATAVLDEVDKAVEGTTILALLSGAPQSAVALEQTVRAQGAAYLDGTIAAYPKEIGLAETMIACSGSDAAWRTAEPVLRCLGGSSRHLGEAVGAAKAYEAVFAAYYMVAWAGFLEAAAFAEAHGLPPRELLPGVDYLTDLLRACTHESTDVIETGEYATDQATIDVFLDGVVKHRVGFEQTGHPGRMLRALEASLERARTAGHGQDGFHVQYLTATEGD
ncbi:MAG: NAD(P)-dependent oxidoreductase [Actinobacteria bacterium]|nr:NAD(P)-dependent oxidoreductase [Actinomycetota bacterium]